MTLEQLSRGIRETYGFNSEYVLSGKIGTSELGQMLKTVIENDNDGRFYFPDALYDSNNSRKRKLSKANSSSNMELKDSAIKLMTTVQSENLILYKFRSFIPQNESDNVWKPQTIKKAKTFDTQLNGDNPRVSTIERQSGRNGKLHIQGLIALLAGDYDQNIYQELNYSEMETGIIQWLTYLSKVKDCRLEREYADGGNKLIGPFEHALDALGEWYAQSLRNRRNGVKRNPRTVWYV